jgi:hypothetical protein
VIGDERVSGEYLSDAKVRLDPVYLFKALLSSKIAEEQRFGTVHNVCHLYAGRKEGGKIALGPYQFPPNIPPKYALGITSFVRW